MAEELDWRKYLTPQTEEPPQPTLDELPFMRSKGSWYSQFPQAGFVDREDRPGSAAFHVGGRPIPDEQQGIALPSRATLGQWFDVQDPDGRTHRLQQTDVGPARWTGRGVDISAAAASKSMGYTPQTFPTDKPFGVRPASGPPDTTDWRQYAAQAPAEEPTVVADSSGTVPWRKYLEGAAAKTAEDAGPAAAPVEPSEPGLLDYPVEAAKQTGVGLVESGVAMPLRGIAALPDLERNRQLGGSIAAIQAGADINEALTAPPQPEGLEAGSESQFYKAGDIVSKAVGSDVPSPILHPVVTDVFRGIGSVGGSIASTPLTLGSGPLLAGMGEALQNAVQAGATPEQQQRAGELGTIAGATDYADLLLAAGGGPGKALGMIKRIGMKALTGFFIEGGQEGLQQGIQNAITKGVYNPDKDLMDDVPYSAFIGGIVGAAVKAPGGIRKPEAATPVPTAEESTTALATPSTPPVEPTLVPAPVSTPEGELIPKPLTPEAAFATHVLPVNELPPGGVIHSEPLDESPILDSKLYRAAEELPSLVAGSQVAPLLRNRGVSEFELNNAGIDAFAASRSREVSRGDVIGHLEESGVRVELVSETPKGVPFVHPSAAPGPTLGMTELRLTMPRPQGQEAAFVSQVQATTRIDKSGKPQLHIEGLQPSPLGLHVPAAPAPFKSDWVDLSARRIVRWAADNGYSSVSWSDGEHAGVWDLRGAQGITEPVTGLKEFYNKTLPSRMAKAVKPFGGVLGAVDVAGAVPGQMKRVFHVTLPAAIQTEVRRSVPIYEKGKAAGPHSDVVIDKNVIKYEGKAFVAAARRMSEAFNVFAKKFGFDQNVTLHIVTGDYVVNGHLMMSSVGTASKDAAGRYHVHVRTDYFNGNVAAFLSTMMHEFGHVVVYEKFGALPDATKLLMLEEYRQWRDESLRVGNMADAMARKRSATRHWFDRNEPGDLIKDETAQKMNYHFSDPQGSSMWGADYRGFHEYMADQIARWATTTAEPLTIIERAYSGIAKALRLFNEWMAKELGVDPRPSLFITNWLNSFVSSAAPMTAQEYAALDIRTQKLNQYYVQQDSGDPNATGVRTSPAVATVMTHVTQAMGGGPIAPGTNAAAAHASKINWLYEWAGSILDLVQRNPGFKPLIRYVERVRNKDREEKEIHDAAMRVAKSWRGLGKKAEEKLAEFLDELTNMTYLTPQERTRGITRHPTQQEVRALAARVGVEPRGLDVAVRVRNFTETLLDLTSDMARVEANKITDPNVRIAKLSEINAMVARLKARPYFPFMRFGRHFVVVKNPNGVTTYFEMFERRGLVSAERQQQKKLQELKANAAPGDVVEPGLLPKTAEPFVGLPSVLLQHIRDKLNLTPLQLDGLEQLQFELSPARSFKHHFQHKRYVPGYSRDFLRAFSRYAFFGARYYAKVKYADDLRQDIRDAVKVGGNVAVRIADFMQDHLDNTILDSKGDYGTLKGLMFLWAMGYSPASATLNMTQTPMVTFPFLAAQFGGIKASRVMSQTMHKLSNFYKKGTYEAQQEWELRAFGYGIKTGRIVETQSAELSALGQAGLLNLGSNTIVQRGANQVMEKSALFFELAEQWNRRIAFRAAMRLAYENPGAKIVQEAISRYPSELAELTQKLGFTAEQAQAIVTAGHITDRTQFVYASWARPRFMRGKLPGSIFIFKRYLQSLMFLLGSDSKFFFRYAMIAALMGGMGGLPGYEDIKNLVVAMLRFMGFNADAEVAARQMVKDYMGDAIPADMILHGLARRGFGIPAALDALGSIYTGRPGRGFDMTKPGQNVPFPQLDRSKAVTPGPVIPEQVWQIMDPTKTAQESLGGASSQALGYGFSAAFNAVRAVMDPHLKASDPKRWEKAEPRALASLSKMYRALTEGRERTGGPAGGTTITNYDIRDPEQMMEVIALGLGYNDLRRSNEWNRIMAQNEHSKYVDMQRKGLMENYHEAIKGDNDDDIDRAKQKIMDFNSGLSEMDVGKRITPKGLTQSFTGREKERIARETNVPTQKGKRPIAEEFETLFPRTIELRPR